MGLGPAHLPAAPPPPSRKLAFQPFLHPGLEFLGLWAACVHLADGKLRATWANDLPLAAMAAQLLGVSVSTGLLASPHLLWLTSLSLGLQADMPGGRGQTEEVGSGVGGGMGEAAVSQMVLPARQPYLGFQEGPVSGLSEPPSWRTDGKGEAPGRGCISCRQGALWAGQVHSRCEQAQDLGSRVQKRRGWRRPMLSQAQHARPVWAVPRLGCAEEKASILHSCSAGIFPDSSLWKR